MAKDRQLTLRISADLLQEIDLLVEDMGTPRASVLRLALMEGVRYLRERYGKDSGEMRPAGTRRVRRTAKE